MVTERSGSIQVLATGWSPCLNVDASHFMRQNKAFIIGPLGYAAVYSGGVILGHRIDKSYKHEGREWKVWSSLAIIAKNKYCTDHCRL